MSLLKGGICVTVLLDKQFYRGINKNSNKKITQNSIYVCKYNFRFIVLNLTCHQFYISCHIVPIVTFIRCM